MPGFTVYAPDPNVKQAAIEEFKCPQCGAMAKAGMWLGLQAETLTDRSDAHIAEIVIQGATMGVIEMTKALNNYGDADPRARGIASDFVVRQNEVIDRQKGFLV